MDDELKKELEAKVDEELDNEGFWEMCDALLELQHGEQAKRWLIMLEDPDPDDLIFEYMRIVRRSAYVQGYAHGMMDETKK